MGRKAQKRGEEKQNKQGGVQRSRACRLPFILFCTHMFFLQGEAAMFVPARKCLPVERVPDEKQAVLSEQRKAGLVEACDGARGGEGISDRQTPRSKAKRKRIARTSMFIYVVHAYRSFIRRSQTWTPGLAREGGKYLNRQSI